MWKRQSYSRVPEEYAAWHLNLPAWRAGGWEGVGRTQCSILRLEVCTCFSTLLSNHGQFTSSPWGAFPVCQRRDWGRRFCFLSGSFCQCLQRPSAGVSPSVCQRLLHLSFSSHLKIKSTRKIGYTGGKALRPSLATFIWGLNILITSCPPWFWPGLFEFSFHTVPRVFFFKGSVRTMSVFCS